MSIESVVDTSMCHFMTGLSICWQVHSTDQCMVWSSAALSYGSVSLLESWHWLGANIGLGLPSFFKQETCDRANELSLVVAASVSQGIDWANLVRQKAAFIPAVDDSHDTSYFCPKPISKRSMANDLQPASTAIHASRIAGGEVAVGAVDMPEAAAAAAADLPASSRPFPGLSAAVGDAYDASAAAITAAGAVEPAAVGMVWQAGEAETGEQQVLPAIRRVRGGNGEGEDVAAELPGSPGDAVLAAMDEEFQEVPPTDCGPKPEAFSGFYRGPSPVPVSPFSAPIAQQGAVKQEQNCGLADESAAACRKQVAPAAAAAGPSNPRPHQQQQQQHGQQQAEAVLTQQVLRLSQPHRYKQRRQSCPEVVFGGTVYLHQQEQQQLADHPAAVGADATASWGQQQQSTSVESRFAASTDGPSGQPIKSEELTQALHHRSPLGLIAAGFSCGSLLARRMRLSSSSAGLNDGVRVGPSSHGVDSNAHAGMRQSSKRSSIVDDLQQAHPMHSLSAWGSACMSNSSSMMMPLACHGSGPEQLQQQLQSGPKGHYEPQLSGSQPCHRRMSSGSVRQGLSTLGCSRQDSVSVGGESLTSTAVAFREAGMTHQQPALEAKLAQQQRQEEEQGDAEQQPGHSPTTCSVKATAAAVALGERDWGLAEKASAAAVAGVGAAGPSVCAPPPSPRPARRQRRRSFVKLDPETSKQQKPDAPDTPRKRPGSNCSSRVGASSPELAAEWVGSAAIAPQPDPATAAAIRNRQWAGSCGPVDVGMDSHQEGTLPQQRVISSSTVPSEWPHAGSSVLSCSPQRECASSSSMMRNSGGVVQTSGGVRLPLLGFEGLSDADDDDRSPRCGDGGRMHVSPAGVVTSRPGSPWKAIAEGSAVVKQVARELAQGGEAMSASKLAVCSQAKVLCEPVSHPATVASEDDDGYPLSDDYHSGHGTGCCASRRGSMAKTSRSGVKAEHGSSGMDIDIDGTKGASLGNVSSTSIGDSAALRGAADMAFAGFSAFNVKACQERNQEKIKELTKQWEEAAQQEKEEEEARAAAAAAAIAVQQQAALIATVGGPVLVMPLEAGLAEQHDEGMGSGSSYGAAAAHVGGVGLGADGVAVMKMLDVHHGEQGAQAKAIRASPAMEGALQSMPTLAACHGLDPGRMSADGSWRGSLCRSSLDGYRGSSGGGVSRPHSMRRLSMDGPVRGILHVAHSAGMAPLVIPPQSGGSSGLHSPHLDAMAAGCIGLPAAYVPTVPLSPMPVQGMPLIAPWAEPPSEAGRVGIMRGSVASLSGALPSARRSEVWLGQIPLPPWEVAASPAAAGAGAGGGEFTAQRTASDAGIPQNIPDGVVTGLATAAKGPSGLTHAMAGGSRRCSCSAEVADATSNGNSRCLYRVDGQSPPLMICDMDLFVEGGSTDRLSGDVSGSVPDAGTNEWQQNLVQQAFRYNSSVAVNQPHQQGMGGPQGLMVEHPSFGEYVSLGRQSSGGAPPLCVGHDGPLPAQSGFLDPSCSSYAAPGSSGRCRGSCSPSSGVQAAPCGAHPAGGGCGCSGSSSPWGMVPPSVVPRLSDPSGCTSTGRVCYSSDGVAPASQGPAVGACHCTQAAAGMPQWCGNGGVGCGFGLSVPNTPGSSGGGGAFYGAPFPVVRVPQISEGGGASTPTAGPSTSMYRALLDSVPDSGRKYSYRMSDTGTATGQLSRFASMLANSNYSPGSSTGGIFSGSQTSAARGDDVAAAVEALTRQAALAGGASIRRRTGTIPSDVLLRRLEGASSSCGSTSACNSPHSSPSVGAPTLVAADKPGGSAGLPNQQPQQQQHDGDVLGSVAYVSCCDPPGTVDAAEFTSPSAAAGVAAAPHAAVPEAVQLGAGGGGRCSTVQRASRLSYPGTS